MSNSLWDFYSSALMAHRRSISLLTVFVLSILGFFALRRIIRAYRPVFMKNNFTGRDLCKPSKPIIPEAHGVLAGGVYLVILFIFIPIPFWKYLFGQDYTLPEWNFIQYLAGLLSICCMIFLGFVDDALDLKWRHKVVLPSIASLPLLMVYFSNVGTTHITVPIILRNLLGGYIDIGFFYYIYMACTTIFCTNAINIYAGINGLEVGQSLVIAMSLLTFNVLELLGPNWQSHLFSLYFLIPFVFVSYALYEANRYPARVFVGDTFCYFAGMTLSTVGILGHFSKTLLLFFVPQIFNFVYSVPQLYELIPCPRHRMPHFNPNDGLLYPSKVRFHPKSLSRAGELLLTLLTRLNLVGCGSCASSAVGGEHSDDLARQTSSESGGEGSLVGISGESSQRTSVLSSGSSIEVSGPKSDSPVLEEEFVEVTNMTLINLALRVMGPLPEKTLTNRLLILQLLCSLAAFQIRYPIAWLFYGFPSK